MSSAGTLPSFWQSYGEWNRIWFRTFQWFRPSSCAYPSCIIWNLWKIRRKLYEIFLSRNVKVFELLHKRKVTLDNRHRQLNRETHSLRVSCCPHGDIDALLCSAVFLSIIVLRYFPVLNTIANSHSRLILYQWKRRWPEILLHFQISLRSCDKRWAARWFCLRRLWSKSYVIWTKISVLHAKKVKREEVRRNALNHHVDWFMIIRDLVIHFRFILKSFLPTPFSAKPTSTDWGL